MILFVVNDDIGGCWVNGFCAYALCTVLGDKAFLRSVAIKLCHLELWLVATAVCHADRSHQIFRSTSLNVSLSLSPASCLTSENRNFRLPRLCWAANSRIMSLIARISSFHVGAFRYSSASSVAHASPIDASRSNLVMKRSPWCGQPW